MIRVLPPAIRKLSCASFGASLLNRSTCTRRRFSTIAPNHQNQQQTATGKRSKGDSSVVVVPIRHDAHCVHPSTLHAITAASMLTPKRVIAVLACEPSDIPHETIDTVSKIKGVDKVVVLKGELFAPYKNNLTPIMLDPTTNQPTNGHVTGIDSSTDALSAIRAASELVTVSTLFRVSHIVLAQNAWSQIVLPPVLPSKGAFYKLRKPSVIENVVKIVHSDLFIADDATAPPVAKSDVEAVVALTSILSSSDASSMENLNAIRADNERVNVLLVNTGYFPRAEMKPEIDESQPATEINGPAPVEIITVRGSDQILARMDLIAVVVAAIVTGSLIYWIFIR